MLPCDGVRIVHQLLPECGIVAVVEGSAATPRGDEQPGRLVALHVLPRGHAVALGETSHLRRIGGAQVLKVGCVGDVRGVALRIGIVGHKVHAVVAGIPVGVVEDRRPNPKQVVNALRREIVEHIVPQPFEAFCPVVGPPEPAAGGFVQGAPKDGYALLLIVE